MDIIKTSYSKSTASTIKSFDDFWRDGMATVPTPIEEYQWVRHGDFRNDPVKKPIGYVFRQGRIVLPGHC